MQITITAKHIADGKVCGATRCPIALALLEALGTAHYASVGLSSYTIGSIGDGTQTTYRLTQRARSFIVRFDGNVGVVRPCTMELGRRRL